jgi:hypothetical protein
VITYLDGTREKVTIVRKTSYKRRTVEEDMFCFFGQLQTYLGSIYLAPVSDYLLLLLWKVEWLGYYSKRRW